ncbi:MAG TPA: DUF4390 domain-containing protein [Thermodesulfobacteriota bacterium]|nr:DUF4390 domain-containing protein [Deltaproteobacteria bacterium]HNR13347.1 DUF4390 domain-containing protein [Thermodesulfobacteriota bacterium]
MKRCLTVVLHVLILALVPIAALAQEASIKAASITNSPSHLQINIKLINTFSPEMDEAIRTGIPTSFEYLILLYRHHSFTNDKLLTSVTVTKTIKYNTLKQEYVVTEGSTVNGTSSLVLTSLEEAKKVMNSVKVPFYPMWKLERNESYYVKIKAQSRGVEPPGYVDFILFFMNWMNFETDWVIEKFFY